ncbi:uncharacterized protein EDB93DRAFT_1107663 [Suillus bovinus]|uniref:uncharacterized protein n=1 Tax=Suillus bovinus TaxID=48563 RepID=UPI001B883E7B|nr:uncharacterized protein EDB93DRAFT_1107663 [Suillus bovinus]KAG2133198.1 hypothetical protein EDB93DRAFT_1107663 [Suillus bovinus]
MSKQSVLAHQRFAIELQYQIRQNADALAHSIFLEQGKTPADTQDITFFVSTLHQVYGKNASQAPSLTWHFHSFQSVSQPISFCLPYRSVPRSRTYSNVIFEHSASLIMAASSLQAHFASYDEETPEDSMKIGPKLSDSEARQILLIIGTSGKLLLKHIIANRSLLVPSVLAWELSLEAVSEDDNASTRAWCVEAVEALPEEAEAVHQGNPPVLNKLVGKVMQLSRGRADVKNARVVLEDVLRR